MKKIIEKGIYVAYCVGISGAFYESQFVSTHEDWIDAMKKLWKKDCHGYGSPIGCTFTKIHDGYVYGYQIDTIGDWDSQCFTTVEIAGDITEPIPNY